MGAQLKPGDRIRVTESNRVPGWRPGDMGTVVDEVINLSGDRFYLVAMDNSDPSKPGVVFMEGEIEADG